MPQQGTITGRFREDGELYNHFIVSADGMTYDVNLEKNDWKQVYVEQVMVVLIPRTQQNNEECRAAKLTELEKLKKWKAYKVVPDEG